MNKELIDFDEDYIAPQLNYMFGNYGFKFEQALPGQEAIEVVAPNGKRKVISVDTFSDKKDLESSNELKAFIEQNKPKIVSMANQYSQYERKFNSEEEVAKSFKMINEEANALAQEQRSVAERYAAVQKEMEYLSTPAAKLSPDYAERLAKFNTDSQEVNSSIKQLSAKESDVIVKQRKLDKSVGMYTEMKSEQGGIFGAMYNAAVGSVGSSAAAKVSVFNDLVTAVIPLEYQMGEEAYRKSFIEKASANGISIPPTLSKENFNAWVDKLNEDVRDNIDSKILDENRKTLKNEMLPVVRTGLVEMIGDKGTTKEYIAKKQEEYIAGGLIGLGGSAPAIGLSIGAAPVGMAEFFFLGMDATMQQMSAPEFKDVSETEKYAVAVPVGIVNAVLEEFGFRNVIGKSGVVNNILTRTLNKSTKTTTAKTFKELVENEIESDIARGVLTFGAAGLAEAETGAAQAAAEIGIQEIYNTVKEKKLFQTPNSMGEFVDDVLKSGAQEAVGGFVMGMPSAISTAYNENNYEGVTDAHLEAFRAFANDENVRSAFGIKLKNDINSGKITAEQARQQLDGYTAAAGLLNSLPDDLSNPQKRKAIGLLQERKKLENEIQNKDEALTKKQRTRIAEINTELESIAETPIETVAPTVAPTVTPTMTLEEVQPNLDAETADFLSFEKERLISYIQNGEEFYNEQKSRYEKKNLVDRVIDRLLGRAPSYDDYVKEYKDRLKLLESDPVKYLEQRLTDEKDFAKQDRSIADKTGAAEDIEQANYVENVRVPQAQERLDNLKKQINAIQKPSTEEGVLRRQEPEMGLRQVGEGDQGQEVAQAAVPTQEGVVSSRTLEEEVSMLEDMLSEEEQVDVVNEFGEPVDTVDDAKAALSRGDFVYVIDEMTETPTLVSDVTMLDNYTPENIAVVSRANMPGAQERVQPTGAPQLLGVEVGPGSLVVSDTQAMADLRSRTTDARKSSVLNMAEKAIRTLKSIFPDMDIVLHENSESYRSALGKLGLDGSRSSGTFNYGVGADGKIVGGRVDIDLSSADAVTVAHEVAHAVMLKAFGDNPALFKKFKDRISKVLSESRLKELNRFASNPEYSGDIGYEEFLVQLAGLMSANGETIARVEPSTLQKIVDIINDIVSTITNGAIVPFEGTPKIQEVVDFLNTMSSAIAAGESIDIEGLLNEMEAYSNAIPTPVSNPSDFNSKQYKSKASIGKYEIPKGANPILKTATLPTKSLTELVKQYDGRVVIITSDATGYGVDSDGAPILGGFGFCVNAKNNQDNIGFASVNVGTVKTTYTLAEKAYGKGKCLVLVMVQPPHTTINNSYGAKYILKGLKELASKSKSDFELAKDGIKNFIKKSAPIQRDFNNEKTRSSEAPLIRLIDSINSKTDIDAAVQDFLSITTFNIRKELGLGILLANKNTRITEKTNSAKVAFNSLGYNIFNFLKEYGDSSILDDNIILNNRGGLLVGGFELDVLPTSERDKLILDTQKKGIKHPLFNAKLPGTNHFVLDGIYDVQENFGKYAKKDLEIALEEGIVDSLVKKYYQTDEYYDAEAKKRFADERKKGVPEDKIEKRYGDLTADTKSKFKYEYLTKIKGALKEVEPKLIAKVAKGEGFVPRKGVQAEMKSATFNIIQQFEKASPKSKPKIKSKAQVAVHKDTGFVPVGFWVEQLRDKTKYLDDVIKSILDAREELKQGKVKDRKVAKSYLITLASMGSGGGYLSKWIDKTGQKISGVFTEKTRGKDWIRPEGAAAAYLVTPEGEKLTDDIINGTATEEQIKKLFLYVGVGRENKKTEYVLKSMKNDGIKKMTDMFNENKGSDFNALYRGAIKNLSGIAEGKTGFFNQYFGVAERGVVDARQLNAWIAGQMKLTDEQKAKKKKVAASKKLGDQLLGYIEQVGIELGYPKDLAGYIAHHAIWDAIANSVTTHAGEYAVVSKAQVKEEGAGKEKYRVAIVFKSRYGSRNAKPYEFNDRRHFENWLKKYGSKYEISDIYELNSKAQLSRLRGVERIVELGRASGFSDDAITTVLQKKGYSQSEIDEALKTNKAASKVVVEETFAEGYDRMMGEVDSIIEKGLNRGTDQEKILDNVINYIQGSKVYENATNVQQEQLIRDARAAFGKKEKSAPSVKRILGMLKNVKNITMSDYALMIKQMRDYNRGAKEATTAWKRASKDITAGLRDLVKAGKITTKQAVAVLRRFSNVNMFDPNSIESFVNYMTKVFENADYAERISGLRKKLKLAKDSASRKIGIAESLYPMLSRMLSIDPSMIPDSVLDDYASVVEMLGKRDAVIRLNEIGDVTNTVRGVLDAIDDELSTLETLMGIFEQYPDKVLDSNGMVQFAETVDAMVEDGTITDAEAKILRKYKSKVMPRAQRAKKTEQELADEKDEMLRALSVVDIDADKLATQDERNLARELQKLKDSDAVNELSNSELEKLLLVIDNINNGYLPHYAQLMKEKLNSINDSKPLENSVKKAKPLPISSLYSRLKSILMKNSNAIEVMVQRTPLFYIDQVFGDFKTKDIFNSVLKRISQAMSAFNTAIQRVEDKLNNALDAVAKSHGNDPNKTRMSSYKMMAYMLQLEFQSNPDSKQVNPSADFIKATIKHIRDGKTNLSETDADMLQEILDKFSDAQGNIDADKLFRSFNSAEKSALDTIKGINVDMRDKAVFTSHIIRGDKLTPLNNYVHHNVLHDNMPSDSISGITSAEEFNNMMQPSTRGKSLISRTKGVKPLDFNIFSATQRGANYVLMDYYLTEPIRTARKTINEADAMLEKGGMTKQERDVLKAIRNSFESAVRNTLVARFHNNTFADEVVNFVTKQGYRAVLASTTRWVAELTSNMGFILFADRKSWLNGVKNYSDITMSPSSIDVLTNLKSTQSARLYPSDTLSGRLIDTSIMSQSSGMKGGRAKGAFANATQRIYNNTLKKYKNFVETTADSLISTPDKIMMRPYWFGSFATEFKKITGVDPDFDKIAANDEAYMTENADALEQSTNTADEKSVLAGASDNPFMGILKGQVTPDMNAFLKAFNTFNNYMTRFLIYEYSTARTGIMAAMGNGMVSRKQGAALLGGVATRMVVYSLLTSTLSNALVGMFVDDEDEDDEKSLLQKVGQAMASGMTSLLLGRDFGNVTRTVINYGVEKMNEEFLTGLRNGEYDPYKDAIAYSAFQGQSDKATLQDYLINMAGPLTPVAKTTALIVKKATEEPKKEAAAIGRTEKEINVRIPLEVLGNAGLVPLYKDIRKVVLADIYKGMKKELGKIDGQAKEAEPMNREDMKRYFPDMYEKMYGKTSPNYKMEQSIKKFEKKMNDLDRRLKDEMYNYTPKKKERNNKED